MNRLTPALSSLAKIIVSDNSQLWFCEIAVDQQYMMLYAIWYLYNLENNKNYTKSNTPPWVFFTFIELYKWYQIVQRTTYM